MNAVLAWLVDSLTTWENRRQSRELAEELTDWLSTTPTEILIPALQQVAATRAAEESE